MKENYGKISNNIIMKSAVILAAGISSRMMDFKPLLPFGGSTVIQQTVRRLLEGGAEEVVMVTDFLSTEVEKLFRGSRVRFVHNRDYARSQMFDSVRLGLAAVRGEDIFLVPGDLPQFDPALLDQLCAVEAQAVHPVCRGKNGHPLLLRRSGVDAVLRHDGTRGLKGALGCLRVGTVKTEDPGCLLDIDTPEDYRRLLAFRARSVPTDGECRELFALYGTTSRTLAHCEAVRQTALRLADGIPGIDRRLLETAARLHDAARSRPRHSDVLARELERRGYDALASVVRVHMDLPDEMSGRLSEHSLLYLADKLVDEDRYVGLTARFHRAEEQFRDRPDILQAILRREAHAQRIWNNVQMIHKEKRKTNERETREETAKTAIAP